MNSQPMPAGERTAAVSQWLEESAAGEVRFTPVRPGDARFILELRIDPELNRFISPTPADLAKQHAWIEEYLERERNGHEFYFIIQLAGTEVGTIRMYDFREDSFCWGSWIIKRATPARAALESCRLIYDLGFRVMGFNEAYFSIRKQNTSVSNYQMRLGATLAGGDEVDHFYTLNRHDLRTRALRKS